MTRPSKAPNSSFKRRSKTRRERENRLRNRLMLETLEDRRMLTLLPIADSFTVSDGGTSSTAPASLLDNDAAPTAVTPGATLNWDAALDTNNNNFWDSSINATNTRRWNFGTAAVPVDVSDPNFVGLTKAFDLTSIGNGAVMEDIGSLGLGGTNASQQNATIELVFAPDDLTGKHVLYETGGDGDGMVILTDGNSIIMRVKDGGVTLTRNLPLSAGGQFHQIVGTIDLANDEISLYHNGTLADFASTGGTFNDWSGVDASGLGRASGGNTSIAGGDANSTTPLNGKIALVRYYRNAVLTAAEVKANYENLTTHVGNVQGESTIAGPVAVTTDQGGLATVNGDGTFTYNSGGFNGIDTFDYGLEDSNLVGYWNFDQSSGDALDQSNVGGVDDGTLRNGASFNTTGGIFGGAIELDGVNDDVQVVSSRGVIRNEIRTTSAWIRQDVGNNSATIISWGENTVDSTKWVWRNNAGRLRVEVRNGAVQTSAATDIDDGDWHHVAMTYDATNIRLYVDGNLEQTGAIAVDTDRVHLLTIGEDSHSNNRNFGGLIDEVAIWDRVLSDAEIGDLYNAGAGLPADEMNNVTVTLNVIAVNDPPIANDNAYQVAEDDANATVGNVITDTGSGADNDPDVGDTMIVLAVNGETADVATPLTLPSGAIFNLATDGTFQYDPNGQFESLAHGETVQDTFDYSIADQNALTVDLAAHWTLDNATDGLLDLSGNGRDLTINGTQNFVATGPINGALNSPSGNGNNLEAVGYKGVTGTDVRSLSAWINTNNGNEIIMSWGRNVNGDKWVFRTNNTGELRLEVNGGFRYGTTKVNDGNWHHVAMTWENDGSPDVTDALLYVDGALETIIGNNTNVVGTASFQNVVIGAEIPGSAGGNRDFLGQIDDVAIWNRALSAADITLIYESGTAGNSFQGNDTATVIVTLTGDNDTPTPSNDDYSISEDAGNTSLGNAITDDAGAGADSDADTSDVLTVIGFGETGTDTPGTTVTLPSGADISMAADGTFEYDPNGLFESLAVGESFADSFVYTVTDHSNLTPSSLLYDAAADDGANDTWENTGTIAGFDSDLTTGGGGTTATHTTSPTTSLPGITAAYQFNARQGNVATLDGISNGNDDATFEFWIKPTDFTGNELFFETGGATDGSAFGLNGSTLFWVAVDSGASAVVTSDLTAIGVGEFIQVVGVYDQDGSGANDVMDLYVNGVLVDSDNSETALHDWSGGNAAAIGGTNGDQGGDDGIFGDLDIYADYTGDIAIFRMYENNALTATEVAGNYLDIAGPGTATATVTVTVLGVNDGPTAVDNDYTVSEDDGNATVGNIVIDDTGVGADSDPDTNDTLSVSAIDGVAADVSSTITLPSGAEFAVLPNGSFDYNPNGQFESLAVGETSTDTFDYTVSDIRPVDLLVADARFDSLTDNDDAVGGFFANNPPTAQNEAGLAFQVTFTPAAGDLDSATAAVNLIEIGGDANGSGLYLLGGEVHFISKMSGGAADVPNAFNDLDFASGNDMIGAKSSFGTLVAGTIYTVIVDYDPLTNAMLDIAVITPGGGSVSDNFALTGVGSRTNWTGDDSASALRAGNITNFGGANTVAANPFSEAEINGNPFEGTAGQALYWSDDANFAAATDTATVIVTITGDNDAPTANTDTGTTDEDVVLSVAATGLLTNDTDPDTTDVLTISALNGVGGTSPFMGTSMLGAQVSLMSDGSYDYDPTSAAALQVLSTGESVTDQFTYTVTDSNGGTDTAVVTITVTSSDEIEVNTNHNFVFQPPTAPPAVTTPVVPGADGSADSVQIDLTGGNLEIRVNGQLLRTTPQAAVDIEIIGSADDDSVVLNGLGGGSIDVQSAGGANSLTVDDSADIDADVIVVNTANITGLVDAGTFLHSGVTALNLSLSIGNDTVNLNAATGGGLTSIDITGNAGDDSFELTTNQTTSITIRGEDPTAASGDTLSVNLNNVEPPIVFPAATDGTFASSGMAGANVDVDWTGIESFIFDGNPFVAGDLYVEGTADQDRIIFSNGGGNRILTRINNAFYGPFAVNGTIIAYGEGGGDTITMSGNVNQCGEIHGGAGADYIASSVCSDTLYGDDGNDTLLGGEGDNTIYGGTGNDGLSGRSGNDTLIGQDGNDVLIGQSGSDVLIGDDLNDTMAVGNDQLSGGNGDDLLVGGPGNDILSGQFGNDVLFGNNGDDLLRGNQGEDLLIGGLGADLIYGESNQDRLADGDATNESVEASLLLLMAEWTSGPAGLARTFANAGAITTGDGEIDLLSGGGADDALRFGAEDQAALTGGDVAF
jgi:VCBS repeat-containing protein